MIEINLVPDVKQELLKAQRARSVVISASIITSIVAVGVVVALLIYMYVVQLARGAYLDGQITQKSGELTQVEELPKILTIQNQLATISQLNSEKIMSSRLFNVISAITPPGKDTVTFSQINLAPGGLDAADTNAAAGNGQIRLEGQTASYDTMEAFKKRIENTSFQFTKDGQQETIPLASNINVSDISYGENATGNKVLRFTISFDYPAELLSSSSAGQTIAFKLTVGGNVTDSYLGIPHFAERASDIEGEGN